MQAEECVTLPHWGESYRICVDCLQFKGVQLIKEHEEGSKYLTCRVTKIKAMKHRTRIATLSPSIEHPSGINNSIRNIIVKIKDVGINHYVQYTMI